MSFYRFLKAQIVNELFFGLLQKFREQTDCEKYNLFPKV